jgi:hypothetical protein
MVYGAGASIFDEPLLVFVPGGLSLLQRKSGSDFSAPEEARLFLRRRQSR